VWLDSVLTPLSCSVFDILGVTKETALQLALQAEHDGCTTPASLDTVLQVYRIVLNHQVRQYGVDADYSTTLPGSA
jgi:hypothetical protein